MNVILAVLALWAAASLVGLLAKVHRSIPAPILALWALLPLMAIGAFLLPSEEVEIADELEEPLEAEEIAAEIAAEAEPVIAEGVTVGPKVERVERVEAPEPTELEDEPLSEERTPARLFSDAKIQRTYDERRNMIGVKLVGLQSGGFWYELGVRDGDLITEFNGVSVTTPEASISLLNAASRARNFNITVEDDRGNQRVLESIVPAP